MLAEEPDDLFLRYSLAMELAKEGENERSLILLGELSKQTPPYVPAFFMAGQQLASLSRAAEAREFLEAGITEANRQGNSHAAGEMGDLLASLGE